MLAGESIGDFDSLQPNFTAINAPSTTVANNNEEDYSGTIDNFQDYEEEDEVKQLFKRWFDERFAPDLLPHAQHLVMAIIELLDNQRALLEESRLEDARTSTHLQCIYQLEMERIRFVLASYLQARLWKIETYWRYWQDHPELRTGRFSEAEEEHLQRFGQLRMEKFRRDVLNHLPKEGDIRELPQELGPYPNPEGHVIVRVRKESPAEENIIDPDQQLTQKLIPGDIYVIKWKAAAPLWAENLIELV